MKEAAFDCLALPEAPTFRPTEEEFKDPLKYIFTVVRPQAEEQAGIAKIIPPASFQPSFAINRRSFRFQTRVQAVNELQEKSYNSVAVNSFWEDYEAFLQRRGQRHKKAPTYAGQEIDLYRLTRLVSKRGGYHSVTEQKTWREVANALQLSDKSGNVAYTLRQLYQKLLLPYEEFCTMRQDGQFDLIGAVLDAEYSENKSDGLDGPKEEIDEDEAAEILEAMLGLAPNVEPPKKKHRKSEKDRKASPPPSAAGPKDERKSYKIPENIFTLVCEKCKGGHHEDKIILCDRCDKGWHMFCLSPPMKQVPDGEWVCPSCIVSDLDSCAFKEGEVYTLDEFERAAASFERQWFGGDARAKKASVAEKEAEFWGIVEGGEDAVEVLYGADLDTTAVGSGFPKAPPPGESCSDPYALSPWNLNNIPHLDGEYASMLRVVGGNVPGVTVPWVYVGMLFSAFCWHVEDHQFYSINYHHWGAPKRWYGVPAGAAAKFEAAFRAALPDAFASQPDLLFQLVTMLSPRVLREYGVPVYCATQEPRQFIVTFPGAYHGGFNCGMNCAEAVNMAPADWLRFGASSLARYRQYKKPCVISHEEMLLKVAKIDRSPLTNYWVEKELRRVVEEEAVLRTQLWASGLRRSRRVEGPVGLQEGDTEDAECAICHLYLHLTAVECDCCPRRYTCPHHVSLLCECATSRRRMVYRHTLQELEAVLQEVAARVTLEAVAMAEGRGQSGEGADVAADTADLALHATREVVKQEEDAAHDVQADARRQEPDAAADVAVKQEGEGVVDGHGEAAGQVARADVDADMADALPPADGDDEGDDIADLLGFMAGMPDAGDMRAGQELVGRSVGVKRDRKEMEGGSRDDDAAASILTNGHLEEAAPPPFSHLEVTAEQEAALPDLLHRISEQHELWVERSKAVLQQGGRLVEDLEEVLIEAEQYLWGAIPEVAPVQELYRRLQAASAYMAEVNGAIKSKPSLQQIQEILEKDPKPLGNPPGLDKLREAAEQAQQWVQKAKECGGGERGPVELRALEMLVGESQRLPVTVPEAKVLRDRLTAARKLGESIRNALPTSREAGRRKKEEGPLTVDHMRALRSQATSLKVDMPEIANLGMALERLDLWQTRVKSLTGMRAPLSELEELLEESELLPAVVPEVDSIKALIEKGQAWRSQSEALLSSRAPLKRMRDLLHAGLRLPVEMPQVEQLRQTIRRREWEETARKALNGKHTLHALMDVMATAADMGAEDSQLAGQLQGKVAAAGEWDLKAQQFLREAKAEAQKGGGRQEQPGGSTPGGTTPGGAPAGAAPAGAAVVQGQPAAPQDNSAPPAAAPVQQSGEEARGVPSQGEGKEAAEGEMESKAAAAPKRPDIEELKALVAEGHATGVKMERLHQLNQMLNTAMRWVARAQHCLPPRPPSPSPTPSPAPSINLSGGAAAHAAEGGSGGEERATQPQPPAPMEVEEGRDQAGHGAEERGDVPEGGDEVHAELAQHGSEAEHGGLSRGVSGGLSRAPSEAPSEREGTPAAQQEQQQGEEAVKRGSRPKRRRQPSGKIRDIAAEEEREFRDGQAAAKRAQQEAAAAQQAGQKARQRSAAAPAAAPQLEEEQPSQQEQPSPPPAKQPGGKGKKAPEPPKGPPELEAVEALLAEYDSLIIATEEAEGLRALVARAHAWLEQAQPVLEQDYVTDDQLLLLNSLIAGGEAVGVAMEQLDILKANVEALDWGRRVRALLARLPPLPSESAADSPGDTLQAGQAQQGQHEATEAAGEEGTDAELGIPPAEGGEISAAEVEGMDVDAECAVDAQRAQHGQHQGPAGLPVPPDETMESRQEGLPPAADPGIGGHAEAGPPAEGAEGGAGGVAPRATPAESTPAAEEGRDSPLTSSPGAVSAATDGLDPGCAAHAAGRAEDDGDTADLAAKVAVAAVTAALAAAAPVMELPELIPPAAADVAGAIAAAVAPTGEAALAAAASGAAARASLQSLLLLPESEEGDGGAGSFRALLKDATAAAPYHERPTLDEAYQLQEEGSILPCDEQLYLRLSRYVEAGQDWEEGALGVLAAGSREGGGAASGSIKLKELRGMLSSAEALGMQLPSLARLQELMQEHQAWERRVRELLQSAGPRPSFEDLQSMAGEVRLSPVSSELRRRIDEAVHKCEEWVERCRRCIAKRNSQATLPTCLHTLSYSVDCAVEQFERRLEVEKRLVATGSHLASPTSESEALEDEKELYCLCQQPYNADTAMISCDQCGEWYHMRCVGITQSQAKTIKKYQCPVCVAVKGNLDLLDQILNRLRKTKRPEKEELLELLAEVRALPVAIEEEDSLEKILTKFDRWATATNRAVEVHDASRLLETQGQILPLSDGMLHQLCKSALAMEIDGTEYAEKILRLLRCNKWRTKAEQLANTPGKPGVDAVQRMLQEGERMGLAPEVDVMGARLAQAQALTKQWQDTARATIAKLKETAGTREFDTWVKRAEEVSQEAEQLPLRVERDVDSLQECSKMYCLCQKPYDEQRPMLGCDFCQDWFHYECVGLREPGAAGHEEDMAPEEFRCPICCMKNGVKYPYFHRLPPHSMEALKKAALSLPAPVPVPAPAAAAAAQREMLPPAGAMPFQAGFPFMMPPRGAVPAAMPPMMPAMMPPHATAFGPPGMMELFQGGFPAMMPGMPPVNLFGYHPTPDQLPPYLQQMMQQQMESASHAAHSAPHSGHSSGAGGGSSGKRRRRQQAQQQCTPAPEQGAHGAVVEASEQAQQEAQQADQGDLPAPPQQQQEEGQQVQQAVAEEVVPSAQPGGAAEDAEVAAAENDSSPHNVAAVAAAAAAAHGVEGAADLITGPSATALQQAGGALEGIGEGVGSGFGQGVQLQEESREQGVHGGGASPLQVDGVGVTQQA